MQNKLERGGDTCFLLSITNTFSRLVNVYLMIEPQDDYFGEKEH